MERLRPTLYGAGQGPTPHRGGKRPLLFHATGVASALTGVTQDLHVAFNYGEDGSLESIDVNVESLTLMMEFQLTGAMNDYVRYGPGEELFDNVRYWMFEESGAENDLSTFNACCCILGLNADRVRFMANWYKDRRKRRFYHIEFGKFLEMCR